MKIQFARTIDAGDIQNERIVFNVSEDDILGAYIAAKSSKLDEEKVSSKLQNIYWFPDKDVKRGDLIVLYTKIGVNTQRVAENGINSIHFYYWGLSAPLWISSDNIVVLSRLASWDFNPAI